MCASVLVLERSEMVGGIAPYSAGWCWVRANHLAVRDALSETESYLDYVQGEGRPTRRGQMETVVEAGMPLSLVGNAPDLNSPCPGSSAEGRMLECSLYGKELGGCRDRMRPSVYYRTGVKREEIGHELARDVDGCLALAALRAEGDFLTRGVRLVGGFVREALV